MRVNHGIVEIRGIILILMRINLLLWALWKLLSCGFRLLDLFLPLLGHFGEAYLFRGGIEFRRACVIARFIFHDGRIFFHRAHRAPGLDTGAAPRGMQQTNRNAQLLMNLAAKEIARRRKSTHGFRRADVPASLALGLRFLVSHARRLEHTNFRIVRGVFFFLKIFRRFNRHLHVRLSGTEPDFAHEHILDVNGLIARFHKEHLRFSRSLHLVEANHKLPRSIRLNCLLLTRKGNRHLSARISPSPNRKLLIPLQHHAV